MAYKFDFGAIVPHWELLLDGVILTTELTVIGAVVGVGLGIMGAWARASRTPVISQIVGVYVELIRNTPFLIQLFFIFFGLPALGVKLTEFQAAVLAMIVNLGAYSTEIVRAGIQAVPHGQIEAAQSLAMNRLQIFRYVIILPALQKIWPALSSQIVIVMLGSSVCSQIAAEELTFGANYIQALNFRAFEVYFIVTGIYLVMSILLRMVLKVLGNYLFERRRHV
ncbi:amino acid ABC transporter permease [Thalassospira lucentensis]|uniref:Polar amino acid ABC transporter permease n=1 Tax=Thalassospira lucentensis TaxID=168935 RepID=A0A358HU81_9PROT|nr:amino acid ABC transporter permease [Thalassospira lucentensis]HBU98532.1 polar amino acid ABC transporter permease [Thalassospira lucentensis]HCW69421.1 polar amino acid ABC transporter permease [Thalassospira lucentensis]|tara:strand:- start:1469 stop:2140 length:672 start_codon:yes stop_codon:yes gene_type:complete